MHIKDYLRPPEAAEYLSKKIGQSCSKATLYDLIRDHHLTLLLRFKGYLGLPGPIEDDGYNPTDGVFSGLPFDGYLSCPDQRFLGVMESEGEENLWYQFRVYSRVSGVFAAATWEESAPLEGYVLGTRSEGHTHEGHAGYVTPEWLYPKFKADRDLFICRAELDALIARHQADSTAAPAPVAASQPESEPAPQDTEAKPEDLNAKARTTALQIIAALASYPDLLPLDEPYKSAQVLIAHAASTGQPMPSQETVAQWLKAANPK